LLKYQWQEVWTLFRFEISSSHGGEYDVQSCLLMMEAVRTSETSVDNHFTRQYIPEDNSEHYFVLFVFHSEEGTEIES
jgi:hypothetical protein